MTVEEAYVQYANKGYKVLCWYREQGVQDIPIRDYFRKRMGEEAYRVWESMRVFQDDKKDVTTLYFQPDDPSEDLVFHTEFNVSDTYVRRMDSVAREKFKKREEQRLLYGYWVTMPKYKQMPKNELAAKRKENPLYGMVQLMDGLTYFSIVYPKVYDVDKKENIKPHYVRKTNQYYNQWDALENYDFNTLSPGYREDLWILKPRGVKFSIGTMSGILRNMMLPYKRYSAVGTIDVGDKVIKQVRKFRDLYNTLPVWFRKEYTGISRQLKKQRDPFVKDQKDSGYVNLPKRIPHQLDGAESTFNIHHSKPSATEEGRYNFAWVDEGGLYQVNFAKFVQRLRGGLSGGSRTKSGMMLGGGVMDKDKKAFDDLRKMITAPKANGMFVSFIGAQYHEELDPNDGTGYAPEEKIIRRIEAQRRALRESGNFEALQQNMYQSAIYPEDVFFDSSSTHLDSFSISERIREIKEARELPIKSEGSLRYMKGHFRFIPSRPFQPDFVMSHDGGWHLLELPDQHNKALGFPEANYAMGSDNLNQTLDASEFDSTQEKGAARKSLAASVIIKVGTNETIGYYLKRHADPQKDWEQNLLAALFFNAYHCPEANKAGEINFFLNYSNVGIPKGKMKDYLLRTPKEYRTRTGSGLKLGMHVSRNKASLYHQYIVPYFTDNLDLCLFEKILEEVRGWDIDQKRDTPDLGMAMIHALICAKEVRERLVPKIVRRQEESIYDIQRDAIKSLRQKHGVQ